MRKPTTSRHVYRKINELEELVNSIKENDLPKTLDDVFERGDEEFNNSLKAGYQAIISFSEHCSKIDAILSYLEHFKLNSKQEIKVKYLKEVFLKEMFLLVTKLNGE